MKPGITSDTGLPTTAPSGTPVCASSQPFQERTASDSSVVKTPRSARSWNHLSIAASLSAVSLSVFDTSVRLLPVFDSANEPIERRDAEHDHEVPLHFAVAQPESGVDDERVAEAFPVDAQRLDDRAEAFEVEARNREGDLHLQDVPECAE